jgi:hypothetical protein
VSDARIALQRERLHIDAPMPCQGIPLTFS